MADTNRNTFMRPDTLFGICEAIGQDFGFNPLWLRLAIVPAIFFAPVTTLVAYLAVGLMVLASRLIFPTRPAVASAPDLVATPLVTAVPAMPRQIEEAAMAMAA